MQNHGAEDALQAGLETARLLHIPLVEGENGVLVKLGLRYLHGDGVEKNVEEAVRIFRLAAKSVLR